MSLFVVCKRSPSTPPSPLLLTELMTFDFVTPTSSKLNHAKIVQQEFIIIYIYILHIQK